MSDVNTVFPPARSVTFVRHCETRSNEQGLFGDGPLDDKISSLGLLQLAATKERREQESWEFDERVSGTVVRQTTTAWSVLSCADSDLRLLGGLNEQHPGEWSGKSKSELNPELLAAWRAKRILPPGGESNESFSRRVLAVWEEHLAPRLAEGKKIFVVSSGTPIRMIVAHVLGIPESAQSRLDCDNCSVSNLRMTRAGKLQLTCWNDISHLASVGRRVLPGQE